MMQMGLTQAERVQLEEKVSRLAEMDSLTCIGIRRARESSEKTKDLNSVNPRR
jgi:hypothetical protein